MKHYSIAEMKTALTNSHGMVYVAARLLNCAPQTVYNHLAKHRSLRDAQQQARGMMLDTAEVKLFSAIQNGEQWAIKFFLMTQGRERGYIERKELTGADGGPMEMSIFDLAKVVADLPEVIEGEYVALDEPDEGSTNGTGPDSV